MQGSGPPLQMFATATSPHPPPPKNYGLFFTEFYISILAFFGLNFMFGVLVVSVRILGAPDKSTTCHLSRVFL
jgi:hypothetical protein